MKRTARHFWACVAACVAAALWFGAAESRGEAILQVFNQSHNEIAARLPEIAEAGYTALWVPPPTKANGGMSVGYDLNDPFDLGNSDLRGTWSTRYGVEADLHNLIELCHRFGMRVYFDNVMNHRSYDIPGFNEGTPTDVYPGMCPEDFHLRTTSDGFYRKWDNVRDWNDEWQVMFLGLSDLLDIAHETPNQNFGPTEGSWHDKPKFVRHPNNPEYYCNDPYGNYVGFGNVTAEMLAEHPEAYEEDVGAYLIRAVRWLVDRTKVDGLRLDAVKHVPYYFFGEADSSTSSAGYVGNVQLQFNLSRGFNDWANHRESVFNSDNPRNDAMLFGEHLGNPPPQGPYVSAGMRLVDDRLRNELNWRFSANQLDGFDGDCAGSELGWEHGVMHAQSHDNDFVDRKPLHHAMYFMRRGLGLVYSDGNNHAATLTGSGGAFPRWAQTDFLGQWHQKQIPTLLHAHENFAWYDQIPKWSQGNYIAFQRGGGVDEGGKCWASMLFMLNSGWDFCQPGKTHGDFPHDAYLYDYASDMDSYMPHASTDSGWTATPYAYANQLAMGDGESDYYKVQLEPNSYAIWSYKNPDPSGLYPSPYRDCFVNDDDRVIAPDSRVVTVMEDGQVVEPVWVTRKDGVDGDPDFNPYGVADTNNTDYAYRIALPRVTKGTNVTLAVKADGSAETLLLRLDGGMDFGNGINGKYREYNDSYDPYKYEDREDWRDNPPGAAHDFYLGFENCDGYFTRRLWPEKFAAADTKRCKVGPGDATTYQVVVGGASTNYQPSTEYNADEPENYEQLKWVYHNPGTNTDVEVGAGTASRAKAAKAAPAKKGAKAAAETAAAAEKAPAAEADRGGTSRSSAEWVGKSYIFANGWYRGSGDGAGWEPAPAAFNGAKLGKVDGAISFGGQCQTYKEEDGKGNPARACYNILASGGEIVANGSCNLYWYAYNENNNWFESRTGNEGEWQPTDIDVSGLGEGTYSLAVWFEANGVDGPIYDNVEGANYVATFTVGDGGGEPDPGPGPDDTRATWVGKSYVNVNGTWYAGTGRDGGDPDAWWPEAGGFGGHDLGCLMSLELGGQAQTYGESDGAGHPARMTYRISAYGAAPASGSLQLDYYQSANNNNYHQSGGETWNPSAIDLGGLTPGETYTLEVWFEAEGADGWFGEKKKIRGATFTYAAAPAAGVVPQFSASASGTVVWAKTPKKDGISAFLYYTADGAHFPEGAGGVPANTSTRVAAGRWSHTGKEGDTDWWYFILPAMKDGTVLRYKIGAARVQHGEEGTQTPFTIIWPDGEDAIKCKKQMMSLWTVPGLNFETQSYHKHNDYNSWTTGFKDGYHLVTARMLLQKDEKHPREIANTFRQTFYLDTHVPDGYFLYPSAGETDPFNGKSEYGLVLKTDNTVDEVWYHITDSDDDNDGVGNGITTNGVVEWARATQISPWTKEMAQDTEFTKIWRFTYSRIPGGGQTATVRVRLREVSSVPADEWAKDKPEEGEALEALHVKELKLEAPETGPQEKFYIQWPEKDGAMVEAGWRVQVRYTSRMASGLTDPELAQRFKVYVNATSNGSTNKGTGYAMSGLAMTNEWHWEEGNGLNELSFSMPNAYNGIDGWMYALTVEFDNQNGYGDFHKSAQRMVTHKGPLLPKCIVTTPPETDSDGAPWVITMEDSTAAREGERELRETPIIVLTDQEAKKVEISFVSPTNYAASITAQAGAAFPTNDTLRLTGVETTGTDKMWTFAWQVTNAGTYRFEAKATVDAASKFSSTTNGAFRTSTVRFRQKVAASAANDLDWDNDGVPNTAEAKQTALPKTTDETWVQGEVFAHTGSGEFDSGCPDTDGDGLPDGLELGYRTPVRGGEDTVGTDTSMDTNGDGWPNFIGDLDPPFYNTLDNKDRFDPGVVSDAGSGAWRAKVVAGSVTDPRNPDSDGDGLPDGVEDANRNGWTDGDGQPFPTDWDPYRGFNWADGKMKRETWEETSPGVWDSDADGLCDGYGEDSDFNGWTDMGLIFADATNTVVPLTPEDYEALGIGVDAYSRANSSSTKDPKPYTSRAIDYDALFRAYNVADPNGNGAKQTNGWPRLVILETDPLCADTDHDGLPDGWEANHGLDPLNNGVYDFRMGQFTDDPTHGAKGNPDGDVYDNATEFGRGSNPRSWDSDGTGGEVDPGSFSVGPGEKLGQVNESEYFTEFTWWTLDDLIALDDYNQGGNSSDIYRCGDGFDSSRDMVAFYFRDGGAEDGKLYFRVDFDDLRPFAEESSLNVYVAINYGSYGNGLEALPDDVNCDTEMGWNTLTGVYDSQNGVVYRQEKDEEGKFKPSFQSLPGFNGAYFNSELDAVMWSVDRAALLGDDWQGSTDTLKFQVYTTRDFTGDDGGSGDKGGLNDFTDTIGDDWLCSDYWNDYNNIAANGVFRSCVARTGDNAWNSCGLHAKLAMVAHGNQAIEAGSTIQALVNNGQGAGYDRPIQIHNIYTNCPLNLHITPTLAMALQWAEAGTESTWYSGPAFNAAIKRGVASGALALMGSTYSDHMPKYFGDDFNKANEAAARAVLNAVYGEGTDDVVSKRMMWSAERVADEATLAKIHAMGFEATVIDQTPHLLDWFGRQTALGSDAYKIQRYWLKDGIEAEAKAFVLSSAADNFRYANTDGGLSEDLRHLFLRRARDSRDKVAISSIFYRWEDFADSGNADGYDRSLRWIANHPWIQVVTFDEALADPTLTNLENDSMFKKDFYATNGMAMQDWVHHACNGNYDRWFYGSDRHESLSGKQFKIREGKTVGTPWGTATNGVFAETWKKVSGLTNAQVKALAEATIFASVFETAFHNEVNDNLSRWSYGEYMFPAQDKGMELMDMAKHAQSRTRLAAVYAEVDDWAKSEGLLAYAKDVDLDGEEEYVLRNDRVMALFEAEGGVMVGAWLKDGTNVWQTVGNFAAQSESECETQSTGEDSRRGTALKDVWVNGAPHAAEVFGVAVGSGTLTFAKDGLSKTVRLADASTGAFSVSYAGLDGSRTNYVRNALSPDLATLMLAGQARMGETAEGTSSVTVSTATGSGKTVTARVAVGKGSINTGAKDQPENSGWNTVNLRNAAQVRQVEVQGTGELAFTLEFGVEETEHADPTITTTPEGTQRFPVGKTSSIRVTAVDWNGDALPVEAVSLPAAVSVWSRAPEWDAGTGMLSWHVGAIGAGGRTNDWVGSATFLARDGDGREATATVSLVVPWDANGNGIADDWEWRQFRNEKGYNSGEGADFDDDGFSDRDEWIAGTDPKDDEEFIAWERQVVTKDAETGKTMVSLEFRSVEGALYDIEQTDAHGLLAGGTNWQWQASVTGAVGQSTTWWTGERPDGESRMYRIRVPFFER